MEQSVRGIVSLKPAGYIKPEGIVQLTEQGTHNVAQYEFAEVKTENTLKKLLDTTKSSKYLFNGYIGTNVDDLISYSDTENVTNVGYMFYECSNLTTIPLLNTSNVTDMGYMFQNCSNLTTIPLLDTSNVTNMDSMFYYCKELTSIPPLNTSNVTYMGGMFNNCSKLTTIPQLDTSKVTAMDSMFADCTNLTTAPQLDTSSVGSMNGMFRGCSKLTTIPQLDTSNASSIGSMFQSCAMLKKCDLTYYNITGYSYRVWAFCYRLKAVIIRGFGTNYTIDSTAFNSCYYMLGTTNSTVNPNGEQGYVYVPRDMIATLQSANGWSALQFRALEDYTLDGTTTGEFDDAKAGLV